MNFKKTMFALAVGSAGIMAAASAHAVVVQAGSVLTINAGNATYDGNGNISNVTSGSWFGMDNDGNSKIAGTEKVPMVMGTNGLVIGTATPVGASHSGPPVAGDTGYIDAPWNFFGNTGTHFLSVAATGSTEAGLNMSGWTVAWSGLNIPMGSGAWQPLNCGTMGCTGMTFSNSVANFSWDGTNGGNYVLDYAATVPANGPPGFENVKYYLHLEGTVQAVPEAETYAMMLAGLGLVGFAVARRRRSMV